MQRFKRGDLVWLLTRGECDGWPGYYHHPRKILRRIHPTCYVVAPLTCSFERPPERWEFAKTGRQQHPGDMHPYSEVKPYADNRLDMEEHIKELRERWRRETDPALVAAHDAEIERRREETIRLNRVLRPILARMFR